MEDIIFDLEESLRQPWVKDRIDRETIHVLNKNQRTPYQKIGIVRHNAFKDMGGEMSLTLTPLDHTNSGFVLSTIHS